MTSSKPGHEEISSDAFQRAEALYIIDGIGPSRIAKLTGLSLSQIEGIALENDWTERRVEYRKALSDIRRNTTLLRRRLIEEALETLDPRMVAAVARMEAAANKGRSKAETPGRELSAAGKVEMETMEDAAAALRQVVELKLGAMLADPESVSLGTVREMKQALELIESMESVHCPDYEASRPSGLSPKAADEIRRKILGLETDSESDPVPAAKVRWRKPAVLKDRPGRTRRVPGRKGTQS